MKYLPDSIGLYIHIPFCERKCLYCDFYSACLNKRVYDDYIGALLREIENWGGKTDRPVSTIYIGGGTPSLLGDDILPLISKIRDSFSVLPDAEITAECNPNMDISFLSFAKESGVNRLSFGVQAGSDSRLKTLGRTHTVNNSVAAVKAARRAGFRNISCDIMIALPESNEKTLKEDIDFICSLSPDHISAYILKIEPNTAFYKWENELGLPDEDGAAEQYLTLCYELEKRGYEHYEISNFARYDKKSRHNLKYWRCEEYLGIGPSAHSFFGGKRFYYPRDLKGFISGNSPFPDGEGGDTSERIMLGLRINDGVPVSFFSDAALIKAKDFNKAGLLEFENGKIKLTDEGMLVSNSIITELI